MWDEKFEGNKTMAYKLVPYLLVALYRLGGSAYWKTVVEKAIDSMDAPEELLNKITEFKDGRQKNYLHIQYNFAMSRLRNVGYGKSAKKSSWGFWELTAEGTPIAEQLANTDNKTIVDNINNDISKKYDEYISNKRQLEANQKDLVEGNDKDELEQPLENDSEIENMRNDLLTIHGELDPIQFEQLCLRLLNAMGADVQETKRSGDHGIDAVGSINAGLTSFKVVAQIKRHEPDSKISENLIRELMGSQKAKNAERAIFITTSSYTKPAREMAQENSIRLIDGEELIKLMKKHEVMYKLSLDLDN